MRTSPLSVTATLALFLACILTGCGTPFKYTPSHTGTYAKAGNTRDAEILKGKDVRTGKDRKGVKWNKPVQSIVADALADELRHSGIFARVGQSKNEVPSADSGTYSHTIAFKVHRLRLYNAATTGEVAGGAALGLLGIPGVLIAAAIPTKWESSAEVEFEVTAAGSGQPVLAKTYAATRSISVNGYAGLSQQIRQSSDALEEVVKEFASDLASLSSAKTSGKGRR